MVDYMHLYGLCKLYVYIRRMVILMLETCVKYSFLYCNFLYMVHYTTGSLVWGLPQLAATKQTTRKEKPNN